MRATVLGGCRFLGAETAKALSDKGWEVVVVDNRPCPGGRPPGGARLLEAWPGDPGVLGEALPGSDVVYVFHEYDGVPQAARSPWTAYKENVEAHWNIVRAVVEYDVPRLVYASTAAVYGDHGEPVGEDAETRPKNTYGATRLAGEALARGFLEERGVELVVLRFFNVYGPGEWNRGNPGVVHYMIRSVLEHGYVRIEGDGGQVRDFIHQADAVRAAVEAAVARPGVYNIGSGSPVRILDLAAMIARIHGRPVDVVWAQERPGDVRYSVARIDRARRLLNWEPLVPLLEGLRHLYGYYARRARGPS